MRHHRRGLRRLLPDDELLAKLDHGYEDIGLDDKRVAMLRYCEKLTRTPHAMERADVDALRAVGFSDDDVLHIVQVCGYFAFVNRLADGLGVQVEDWFSEE